MNYPLTNTDGPDYLMLERGRATMSATKGKGKKPGDGTGKGKSSRLSWILVGLALAMAVAGAYLVFMRHGLSSRMTESAPTSVDFHTLVGKWVRPDGGYVISVRNVDPDGQVDAGYFNPRPINVSRAEASVQGKAVKFFMELQAAGYPGSTYELIYDPGSDTLVGIYFQAALREQFQVVFVRTQ